MTSIIRFSKSAEPSDNNNEMKNKIIIRPLITLLLLTLSAVILLTGCATVGKYNKPLNISEQDLSDYTSRTPLRSEGDKMAVRISDAPGEDPFEVLPGAAPDPFVCYDNATDYYYGLSTQNGYIELHRSKLLSELFTGPDRTIVYSAGNEVVGSIWAPEMYFLDGLWYIYTSGQLTFEDGTKHLFVLESESADPFDGFHFKSFPDNSIFAIDPTVYVDPADGRMYICFSQVIDGCQWLSIAPLTSPWEMGESVPISDPHDYLWESLTDGPLNEGPFFVSSGSRLFIIYSANGCYSDTYRLGAIEYNGGDPLSKDSWIKYSEPIFVLNKDDNVFAPGHASFFYSPDHTELWIAYHCYYSRNTGAKRRMRVCHVQKVGFDEDGFPAFGDPLGGDVLENVPSGE